MRLVVRLHIQSVTVKGTLCHDVAWYICSASVSLLKAHCDMKRTTSWTGHISERLVPLTVSTPSPAKCDSLSPVSRRYNIPTAPFLTVQTLQWICCGACELSSMDFIPVLVSGPIVCDCEWLDLYLCWSVDLLCMTVSDWIYTCAGQWTHCVSDWTLYPCWSVDPLRMTVGDWTSFLCWSVDPLCMTASD